MSEIHEKEMRLQKEHAQRIRKIRDEARAKTTPQERKRWQKLYPKVCLHCGSKTKVVTHKGTGKYAGVVTKTWLCPTCEAEWGGYI